MNSGKLIVIEGTDGSGKATQVKLLVKRLKKEKKKVATLAFPQYGKKVAGLIEEYLNNKYGAPSEVSPYAASLFYAMDRFDASYKIRKLLKQGKIVILDRYVDSNVGHQGGKIDDLEERQKFVEWLYDIEYRILNVTKPDVVAILHVPAEIGQKLIEKKSKRQYIKKGKRDAHEADLDHLKSAEASYMWLAEKYKDNHIVVECVENGELLSPEVISDRLYNALQNRGLML